VSPPVVGAGVLVAGVGFGSGGVGTDAMIYCFKLL